MKRAEFFKKEGILGEKDVIFQNYGFFERGIFGTGNFLKKREFCVKRCNFSKLRIFRTGNFLKRAEFFVKHGILGEKT